MGIRKPLSVLLLLLLLSQVFLTANAGAAIVPEGSPEGAEAAEEIIELRTENSETYMLSGGRRKCVIYSSDKYYRTEEGKLEEIDNSVIEQKNELGGITYAYVNAANSFRTYFADGASPSVRITANGEEIAFSPLGAFPASLMHGKDYPCKGIDEFSFEGDNCAVYPAIFEDTDIVYQVKDGYTKEYIVLNSINAPCSYSFVFDTELSACEEDGSISFNNEEGERVFALGALFAVDSAGGYTEELWYSLGTDEAGRTIVTVNVSADYLSDPERVFPILVDPTVTEVFDYNRKDTFISSRYPNSNYYLRDGLRTGKNNDYLVRRSLIGFDLGTSLNNVYSAKLYLKKSAGYAPTIKAYRIIGSWVSSEVTWNNRPLYNTSGVTSELCQQEGSSDWYFLDVTGITLTWLLEGGYTNYGYFLRDMTEDDTSHWTTFYSANADLSSDRPYLEVEYTQYDSVLMALDMNDFIDVRCAYFPTVKSKVEDNRNGNVLQDYYTNNSTTTMIQRFQSGLLLFINSHGSVSSIVRSNNYDYVHNSYTDVINMNQISGQDLSNLRFAMLMTCDGGDGGYTPSNVANNTPANLVEQFLVCGARTVIGFQGVVNEAYCSSFAEQFAKETIKTNGLCIFDAIDIIRDRTDPWVEIVDEDVIVIGGDENQKLDEKWRY
ncbi:MAG: DNRLRE domain-containing protein [Clostridiales bacterium]|nr:DNRLRE domain-containing protein [Clostridiales bacterium]